MKRSLSFVVLALFVASSEGAAQQSASSQPGSLQPTATQAPAQSGAPQPSDQQMPASGGLQPGPAQQRLRQQSVAAQEEPGAVEVRYARDPLILVGVVMLVLGGLFYLMVAYSNRIAQTGPLGTQVTDALITIKQQQIVKALDEKWSNGGYHRELVGNKAWLSQNPFPPVPDNLSTDYSVEAARRQLLQSGGIGTLMPGLTDPWGAPAENADEISKARTAYHQRLRSWETSVLDQAARQQYGKDRSDSLAAARSRTGHDALAFFDYGSLSGQGPEFVLQFTAIVTIIFAVVALGILQRLGEDQAGTILAAIAGYVLGQAVRNARSTTSQAPQPQTSTAAARGPAGPGVAPVAADVRDNPTAA
jgi:hypothetical protein